MAEATTATTTADVELTAEQIDEREDARVMQHMHALITSFRTRALAVIENDLPAKLATLDELVKRCDVLCSPVQLIRVADLTTTSADTSTSTSTSTSETTANNNNTYAPPTQHTPYVLASQPVFTDTASFNLSSLPPDMVVGSRINADVLALFHLIKQEVGDLLRMLEPVTMWVQLTVPKMQDQRGLTVSVKADIIDMLSSGERACLNALDTMPRYFSSRGKLVSSMMKFPLCDDYPRAIHALDMRTLHSLKAMLLDMRSNHAVVFDAIMKDYDHISKVDIEQYHHMY